MKEIPDRYEIFEEELDSIMREKIKEADELIKSIDKSWDQADVVEVLTTANAYLKIVCGDDEALYEDWKYRYFRTSKGTAMIIQGTEIPTEIVGMYGDARDEDRPSSKNKKK